MTKISDFSFLLLINIRKKIYYMIVLFSYLIIYSCFSGYKFDISALSYIYRSLSKNYIIHRLKKVFPKIIFCIFLTSVFILMYGFNQTFWLSLLTLRTFFNTSSWFSASSKLLMCITHSCLSCKLATCFSIFSLFVLSGKSLWRLC